ncbi:hypothetical protein KR50_28900 [Jeotgalibacillus campisalis]|uniref:Uncharacterized protein n=1 Tax=Jeotgalibacillus campisalis TaxID=220754 RepID=A0A0C2VP42_9BACL|nr:hypothetical protein KR50_28900 [Jeotgalibacillus campisalis]
MPTAAKIYEAITSLLKDRISTYDLYIDYCIIKLTKLKEVKKLENRTFFKQ